MLRWLWRLLRGTALPAEAKERGGNNRAPSGKVDAERIEAARQRLKESIPPPSDPEA